MSSTTASDADKTTVKAPSTGDVWDSAPDPADTPIFAFLNPEQRADIVNARAILRVTGMEWESQSQYGARFVATFIAPDENIYKYGFKSSGGKSPRDKTNKWIWEQINKSKVNPIPVVLCKRGNAYYFDRPGADSELDGSGGMMPGSVFDADVPDF